MSAYARDAYQFSVLYRCTCTHGESTARARAWVACVRARAADAAGDRDGHLDMAAADGVPCVVPRVRSAGGFV